MEVRGTAQKLYIKIEFAMNEKEMKRYQLAEKIGVSKQSVSDNMLKLKNGKSVSLDFLAKVEKALNIRLFNF